jgi:hypothetical protein
MTSRDQRETRHRGVSVVSQTEMSIDEAQGDIPFGGETLNHTKKFRRQEKVTSTEVVRDSEPQWTPVERRKRLRSRIESTTGMEGYDGRTGIKVSKGKT